VVTGHHLLIPIQPSVTPLGVMFPRCFARDPKAVVERLLIRESSSVGGWDRLSQRSGWDGDSKMMLDDGRAGGC
jgi:hypothetical protein